MLHMRRRHGNNVSYSLAAAAGNHKWQKHCMASCWNNQRLLKGAAGLDWLQSPVAVLATAHAPILLVVTVHVCVYDTSRMVKEGKAMEEHCFSTGEGGWAAHLCGKRVPPEYRATVNDLVLVALHTLPAPFSMSPLKRDGVCFCVKDSKDAVAVHSEGLRAAAKALTGVERKSLWSRSQSLGVR